MDMLTDNAPWVKKSAKYSILTEREYTKKFNCE